MAVDHRGNPINENNKAKTNKERMVDDITTGMTDAQMSDAHMYFAEKDEYPDMDEEESEEQIRRAEQYAKEMKEYYGMMQTPYRVYGKDEMIEHDRDDDK